jgi:very-short-patch-repair endonuclease
VIVLGHEVDIVWRAKRVVAEGDGYTACASLRSFAMDRHRRELTAAGYRILRLIWEDLAAVRLSTVVRLAQTLIR